MDSLALTGAVAWPATTLVGLLVFRTQVVAILEALSLKLGQAEQISIGKDGLTLVSTIARQNILGSDALAQRPSQASPAVLGTVASSIEDERQEFDRLVQEYDACKIPDIAERIRARRRLADRLGALALSLAIDRKELAMSGQEGRMVALATAVILSPGAGDLEHLRSAVGQAKFNFTRYRIVLALPPALTADNSAEAVQLALSVLTAAEAHPNTDANLRGLVQATRRVIKPR